MSNMIHIKHSIGVDADRPAWIRAIVLHVLCCTHGAFPIYIVRLKEKTKWYLISAQAYLICLETLSAHLLLLEIPLLDLEREFLPEVDCLPPAADEPPTINVLFLFPIRWWSSFYFIIVFGLIIKPNKNDWNINRASPSRGMRKTPLSESIWQSIGVHFAANCASSRSLNFLPNADFLTLTSL